jgi:tRNA(Ile)-lysidine synthase
MPKRSKLTPAVAEVRRLVRSALANHGASAQDLILVACSGGPDSMALAAALAFEGPKLNLRIGALIVDHGIQPETAAVAEKTKTELESLGFDLVEIKRVNVGEVGGLEAAARTARYEAIDQVANSLAAKFVLLGHTLGDQAETVLLGLTRGSGGKSLSGMAELNGRYLRPLLSATREMTLDVCAATDIPIWNDPHNVDSKFTRVRVRQTVLPLLEQELGPGIAEALARTAESLREDNDVLDELAENAFGDLAVHNATSVSFSINRLEDLKPAIRLRVYRLAGDLFGGYFHRSHVVEIDRLITNWHGQKPLALPSVRVERKGEEIVLKSTKTLKPGAC